jgi:8-oxo-dGTP diphosphatase
MGITWYQPLVAVSGLIWRGDEILFLRRVQEPLLWVPPGGRMEAGEEPLGALRREIREETGLTSVEVVAPCIVEGGAFQGREMLFLDFACVSEDGAIQLDPTEHDAWRWLTLDELAAGEAGSGLAAGVPYTLYRWGSEELRASHSVAQIRLSRRILDCLRLRR